MNKCSILPFTEARLRSLPFSAVPDMYDDFEDMAEDYRAEIWATIAEYERGAASTGILDKAIFRALWACYFKGKAEKQK